MRRALTYFLVIFISLSHPLAYALDPPISFTNVENITRTADGGTKGDYWFLNKDKVKKVAKNHKATAKQLGRIFKGRALCGSIPTAIACALVAGLGTDAIIRALVGDGWTIDKEEGKIYKLQSGLQYCNFSEDKCYSEPQQLITALYPDRTYTNSGGSRLRDSDAKFVKFRITNEQIQQGISSSPQSKITTIADVTYTQSQLDTNDNVKVSYQFSAAPTVTIKKGESKRVISDDELAEYVKNAPDEEVYALATSPDYAKENHEVTVQAAAAAADESSEADNTGNPDDDKPDDGTTTDPNPEKQELPEFCTWAKPVCDAAQVIIDAPQTLTEKIDELLSPPTNETEVDVEGEPPNEEIDTQITFSKTCLSPKVYEFDYHGQTVTFGIQDFTPLCENLENFIKPALIALGSFQAILIVSGVRYE